MLIDSGKLSRVTFCLAAVALTLAACGGGKDDTGAGISQSNYHSGTSATNSPLGGRSKAWIGEGKSSPSSPSVDEAPAPTETLPAAPAQDLGTHAGIQVDTSNLPVPQSGTDAIMLTAPREVPAPKSDAEGFEDGAFRTLCNWTHMSYDDPIVYPGRPGLAHHHTFFGNTSVDAFTTPDNIRSKGRASCRGGTVNLSGYWVPSMIDTVSHRPMLPSGMIVYYKTGFYTSFGDHNTNLIQPMPLGLRMITGDSARTSPNPDAWFGCYAAGITALRSGTEGSIIPTCAGGEVLRASIGFNQCWDGVNLDSPDHKSHMSSFVYWPESPDPKRTSRCPVTHPVVLPRVSFIVDWPVPAGTDTSKWRLSSDVYDPALPGGYTLHADWMNGWEPSIAKLWGTKCMQERRDCGSFNLGDGREAIGFQGN